MKVLATRYAGQRFAVLVNMARNEFEAKKTFTQLEPRVPSASCT